MAKQLRLGRTNGSRARRRKFADDQLVPVRGDRVGAALQRDRLTVAAFARDNGIRQQTLDYIVRGKTKRCRQSLLEELAAALAVSTEWLTGEADTLVPGPDVDDGYVAAFPLAWRAIQEQLENTARREGLGKRARDKISLALMHLTDPRMWRWQLFGGADKQEPYLPVGFEKAAAIEHRAREDDWIRATLADVFNRILMPWFRDEAALNVRALRAAAPSHLVPHIERQQ